MMNYGRMAIDDAQEARQKWGVERAGGGVVVEPGRNQVGGKREETFQTTAYDIILFNDDLSSIVHQEFSDC